MQKKVSVTRIIPCSILFFFSLFCRQYSPILSSLPSYILYIYVLYLSLFSLVLCFTHIPIFSLSSPLSSFSSFYVLLLFVLLLIVLVGLMVTRHKRRYTCASTPPSSLTPNYIERLPNICSPSSRADHSCFTWLPESVRGPGVFWLK